MKYIASLLILMSLTGCIVINDPNVYPDHISIASDTCKDRGGWVAIRNIDSSDVQQNGLIIRAGDVKCADGAHFKFRVQK